jgi:integrase
VYDVGYRTDPQTGRSRRQQKSETFRGTKKAAQNHLNDLLRAVNRGEFVERSKLTLGEWPSEWLDKAIKPPAKRPGTYRVYRQVIENRLKPALGAIRLHALKAQDLKRYYLDPPATPAEIRRGTKRRLSSTTIAQHHTILYSALKAATLDSLVTRNVAALVIGKPQANRDHADVANNVWEVDEARAFLAAALADGPQAAAFYALALDSGARKNELCGLQWGDVDWAKGTVTLIRQLVTLGRTPTFGPVKNGTPRTVDLAAETIELLKAHRRHQAELKMRNRKAYHDLGLVFAKEWGDLHGREDSLGLPIQSNNLGQREFARLLKAANVRRIKFHGMRHTSATLALKAGVPIHVVQQRLGHKRVEITLGIYAHVLPSMQADAARKLGALLHGR